MGAETRLFEVVYGMVGEEPTVRDRPAPSYVAKQRALAFLRAAGRAALEHGNEQDAERLDYCRKRLRESLMGEILDGLSISFTNAAGERYHVTIVERGRSYRDAIVQVDGDRMPDTGWIHEYRAKGRA